MIPSRCLQQLRRPVALGFELFGHLAPAFGACDRALSTVER